MKDWTKKYNDLPYEVRLITTCVGMETRIQQLKMEKNRLKRSYARNLKEINDHIKSIKKDLDKQS